MTEMASSVRAAEQSARPKSAEEPEVAASASGAATPRRRTTAHRHFPPPAACRPRRLGFCGAALLSGEILPGDRLGHFELLQYVGGGGMGRVFRAAPRHAIGPDGRPEDLHARSVRRPRHRCNGSRTRLNRRPGSITTTSRASSTSARTAVCTTSCSSSSRAQHSRPGRDKGPAAAGGGDQLHAPGGRGPGSRRRPQRGASRHQAVQSPDYAQVVRSARPVARTGGRRVPLLLRPDRPASAGLLGAEGGGPPGLRPCAQGEAGRVGPADRERLSHRGRGLRLSAAGAGRPMRRRHVHPLAGPRRGRVAGHGRRDGGARRTAIGGFHLAEAIRPAELTRENWTQHLLPPLRAVETAAADRPDGYGGRPLSATACGSRGPTFRPTLRNSPPAIRPGNSSAFSPPATAGS